MNRHKHNIYAITHILKKQKTPIYKPLIPWFSIIKVHCKDYILVCMQWMKRCPASRNSRIRLNVTEFSVVLQRLQMMTHFWGLCRYNLRSAHYTVSWIFMILLTFRRSISLSIKTETPQTVCISVCVWVCVCVSPENRRHFKQRWSLCDFHYFSTASSLQFYFFLMSFMHYTQMKRKKSFPSLRENQSFTHISKPHKRALKTSKRFSHLQ